jgi:hypothetical protein
MPEYSYLGPAHEIALTLHSGPMSERDSRFLSSFLILEIKLSGNPQWQREHQREVLVWGFLIVPSTSLF